MHIILSVATDDSVSMSALMYLALEWSNVRNTFVNLYRRFVGGGPGVVVNTAAFHAKVRGSFPGIGGLK